MKHIQTWAFMVICGVSLLLANVTSAQSSAGVATVVRIKGEARYSAGDKVWHPLVAGKTLGAGAVIQTAADSTVDLVLGQVPVQVSYPNPNSTTPSSSLSSAPDPNVRGYAAYSARVSQNVIRLWGNTVLAIDKLSFANTGVDAVGDTELDLRAGKIFGSVKKLSAMSQFDVKIPNGVAGIRGTTFTISADGTVTVFQGSVVVSYVGANGQTITQVVGSGQQFNPAAGGQPSNLSSSDLNTLYQTSVAVGTLQTESTSFVQNNTKVYVSPTLGK